MDTNSSPKNATARRRGPASLSKRAKADGRPALATGQPSPWRRCSTARPRQSRAKLSNSPWKATGSRCGCAWSACCRHARAGQSHPIARLSRRARRRGCDGRRNQRDGRWRVTAKRPRPLRASWSEQRRAIELTEIEARLAAIEQRITTMTKKHIERRLAVIENSASIFRRVIVTRRRELR